MSGEVDFAATLDNDGEESALAWAVRTGTCAPNDTFTVAGNVGGFSNPYSWVNGQFDATVDMTALAEGEYCFIMNPTDLDLRATQVFTLERPSPTDKNQCKRGGHEEFGFKNQGKCIQFVNTGKDSR